MARLRAPPWELCSTDSGGSRPTFGQPSSFIKKQKELQTLDWWINHIQQLSAFSLSLIDMRVELLQYVFFLVIKGAFSVESNHANKCYRIISLFTLTYRFFDSRHIFQSWSSCYFYKQFLSEDTRWRRFFHPNHKLDYCCSDNPAWYTHKFVYSHHGSRNENMEQGRFCHKHWSLKIGKIEQRLGLLKKHHPHLLALVYRPSSFESRGSNCSKYIVIFNIYDKQCLAFTTLNSPIGVT